MNILVRTLKKILLFMGLGSLSVKGLKLSGRNDCRPKFMSVSSLVNRHFIEHSLPNHASRVTMERALSILGGHPAVIVETGSSAWGTNSSLLFDSYVNSFGGEFSSVDIRLQPMLMLRNKCSPKSKFYCNDSVDFLKKLKESNKSGFKVDLLYLDSWDVVWSRPEASGLHGLAELLSCLDLMQEGSLLLVDDTPYDRSYFSGSASDLSDFDSHYLSYGIYPGKGAYIKSILNSMGRGREIMHNYQLLWQF